MERITCLHYPAPTGPADILLVMLPGAGIAAAEFAANGMVAAVHERGLAVDIIVAQPDLDLYLEDGVTAALHRAVVAPALARGCRCIWLLGISLGGMGALLYASANQAPVAGICLLAPFLGTKGTAAELVRGGGLAAWSPVNSAATDLERRMLIWLQEQLTGRQGAGHESAGQEGGPAIYLGYAAQDRFVSAHKMLGAALPPARVAMVQGGHDWASWTALWHSLLARAPFAAMLDVAGGGR
ncbi:MAG: hypothetical protein B7Z71_00275 [Acidocella sp. 21-58-7]|nr:MAG: hypothetical protein B7Z71_00275 [Acidocella sp. 21-58-7]